MRHSDIIPKPGLQIAAEMEENIVGEKSAFHILENGRSGNSSWSANRARNGYIWSGYKLLINSWNIGTALPPVPQATNNEFLFSSKIGKKGKIKIQKRSSEGKRFSRFVGSTNDLEIFLKSRNS